MKNKPAYFAIYLIPAVLTWALLLPDVPQKRGLIYSILTGFLWLSLILYFPLSSIFREFLDSKFGEIFATENFTMLILVSILTLLSVSCSLMTQAVLYPVIRGELPLVAGFILLVVSLRKN